MKQYLACACALLLYCRSVAGGETVTIPGVPADEAQPTTSATSAENANKTDAAKPIAKTPAVPIPGVYQGGAGQAQSEEQEIIPLPGAKELPPAPETEQIPAAEATDQSPVQEKQLPAAPTPVPAPLPLPPLPQPENSNAANENTSPVSPEPEPATAATEPAAVIPGSPPAVEPPAKPVERKSAPLPEPLPPTAEPEPVVVPEPPPAVEPVTNPRPKQLSPAPLPEETAANSEPVAMPGAVAVFEGQTVGREELYRLMLEDSGRRIFEGMIARKLIASEAKRRNIAISQDAIDRSFDQKVAEMLQGSPRKIDVSAFLKYHTGMTAAEYKERVVWLELALREMVKRDLHVNEVDVINYYYTNRNRYAEPEQVRVSHILVNPLAFSPGGGAGETRAAGEAEWRQALQKVLELKNKLDAGADFAAAAKTASDDKDTAAKGGDLGYFSRGTMLRSFEDAAFALTPGQTSDPVKTRLGYHLIRLVDRKPARQLPYQEIKDRVQEDYEKYLVISNSTDLISRLRAEAIKDGRLKILEKDLDPAKNW